MPPYGLKLLKYKGKYGVSLKLIDDKLSNTVTKQKKELCDVKVDSYGIKEKYTMFKISLFHSKENTWKQNNSGKKHNI